MKSATNRIVLPLVAVLVAVTLPLTAGTAHAAEVSWVAEARAVHGTDWAEIRSVGSGYYNNYVIVCDYIGDPALSQARAAKVATS